MGDYKDILYGKTGQKTSGSLDTENTPAKRRVRKERSERLPRGVSPRQVVEEYYIPDEMEREAIKAKGARDVPLLMDVLDNMQRLGYAARSGIMEGVRSVKYQEESPLKTISDVGKATVKGFNREEKVSTKDILKEAAPDFLKEAEGVKLPEFEIWGIDKTFKPTLGDVIDFAGDTATDPVTWIPFGWFTKLGKTAFVAGGKSAKAMAKVVPGGEKALAATMEKGAEAWYNTFTKKFNPKGVFKKSGLDEGYIETVRATEAIPYQRQKDILEAVKVERKSGVMRDLFRSVYRKATLGESEQIGKVFHKASDELFDLYGERMAKEFGMGVDDYLLFNKTKTMLDDALASGAETIPADVADFISKTVGQFKLGGTQQIKELLMRKRGIVQVAKRMARFEKEAALAMRGYHNEVTKKLYRVALDKNLLEAAQIRKALKGDLKLAHGLLDADIKNATSSIKSIQDDFASVLTGQAAPDMVKGVKDKLNILKINLRNLTIDGVDKTKVLMKNVDSLPQRKIDSLIKKVELEIGQAQIGELGRTSKEVIGEMDKVFTGLKRELRNLRGARKADLGKLSKSSQTYKQSQQKIVSMFNERVASLSAENAGLLKQMAREARDYSVAVAKAPAQAQMQARTWVKALNALDTSSMYHKVVNGLKDDAERIMAKEIATLPKELQDGAWKIRELLDRQGLKLKQEGYKTIPHLYAPRAMAPEFVEEYTKQLAQYRGGAGHLKPRKLGKYTEFEEHLKRSGVEPIKDFHMLVLDTLIKGDMAVAKTTFKKQVISKFGDWENVPVEIKKQLKYFFEGGSKIRSLPFYGKALSTTKFMLTGANPAFYGRNTLGMPSQIATSAGMFQAINPRNFIDSMSARFRPNAEIKTAFGNFTMKEIEKAEDAFGYFATSQMRGDVTSGAKFVLGRYGPLNPMRYIGQVFNMAAHVEDFGRRAAVFANLRSGDILKDAVEQAGKGASKEQVLKVAMERAQDSMFNYNLITSPADKAIDGVLGFWTFTRKNFPRQFMNIINDPKQYSTLSRLLDRVSNREAMTNDEIDVMNQYDKETITVFGTLVDGIREFTSLGFTMPEEFYRTYNAVTSGDIKEMFAGRISPLISAGLDLWYGYDSFGRRELQPSLPAKYTGVINKAAREALGLTVRDKPKYRGGEVVGTEQVLYGDPRTIFMLQRFPLTSRIFNDVTTLVDSINKGKTSKGVLKYVTGIRKVEMDVEGQKFIKESKRTKALDKAMKARGAKYLEILYAPGEQKKSEEYKQAIERLRGN